MKKVKQKHPIKKLINKTKVNKEKDKDEIEEVKKDEDVKTEGVKIAKKEKPIKQNKEKKDKVKKEKPIKQNKEKKDKIKKDKIKEEKPIKQTKIKKVKSKNSKPKRSLWKRILTVILIIGIVGILLLTIFFGFIVITAPKFSEEAFNVKDQTVVYDANGDIIAKLGSQKRESVNYDQLPQVLIDAIIATEDSRFFQHNGVDLPRFLKATVQQLAGQGGGGASTLTMQTVKNNLTKKDKKETNSIEKIIRKFQDVYLAVFKVEKEYSKEQILELYVNNYNLGSNVYGVGEAAKYYFGKPVSDLTLPEASLIAGLFQAPGRHNPYRHIESATSRRNTVLNLMVRHEYITKKEAEIAKKIPIDSLLVGIEKENDYHGFIDIVVEEVEDLTGDDAYTTPMKIYTTMEPSIQKGINSALNKDDAWYWRNDKLLQAAVAVVNVETGAISAVGNGRNRTGERIFNFATDALRQPGSTAKPLFDYGPGIEYNNFSTYTLFNDEPWGYTNGPSINNWDGQYQGLITARRALSVSRNIPALKAFQITGPKNSRNFVYKLGLDVALNKESENYRIVNQTTGADNVINEAYAIGGVSEGFSPLSMASAYAGFASGGYYTKPYSVTKIEYRETGEVKEYKPTKERVMKDSTAYIMNNILEYAVNYGFNGGARVYGSHVAAKTGTSNYDEATLKKYKLPYYAINDLWTVAYTSQYSIAVWYGYENIYDKETDRVTYNTEGGGYKEGLVREVMKYIPKDTKGWKMPSSVVASKVEKETWPAKLPSKYTPSDMIATEYFVRGAHPTEVSKRYDKLNDITNVNDKANKFEVTITWDYKTPTVLTDEYLKKQFNQSLYGNQKDKYLQARLDYNKNTLGDIGFAIYEKDENGSLHLIDFVKENKYTYKGYGNKTLVIKAEHEKFKSNASDGVEVKIKLGDKPVGILSGILNGTIISNETVGNYKEKGLTLTYTNIEDGAKNVTNDAEILYQVVGVETKEFNTVDTLESYINSLPAGTYKIKYIATYQGQEFKLSRTIILK